MSKLKIFWILYKRFCVSFLTTTAVLIALVGSIVIINQTEQAERDYCKSIGKVRVKHYHSDAYCADGVEIGRN